MSKRLFTSESVTEGHPDKICDFVADSILDAILMQDPEARVACEVCVTTNFMLIMGEISTTARVDYEQIARGAVLSIGYNDEEIGFDGRTCEIKVLLDEQSPDIARGVDEALEVRELMPPLEGEVAAKQPEGFFCAERPDASLNIGVGPSGELNCLPCQGDMSGTAGCGVGPSGELNCLPCQGEVAAKQPEGFSGVNQPDSALNIGAGDQGQMFGYASNETPELMPLPVSLAHALTRELTRIRKSGELPYLRPDAKSQVTVEYGEDGAPKRIDAVVLSTQHTEDVTQDQIRADIKKHLFDKVLPKDMIDADTKYFINPTGKFVIGGPRGDSGLTGRKIIVDTYGGMARHGGGSFSGKDPSKVDRSAAYAARYVAKNIVAAGLADKCEIQVSYAIGVATPTSIMVDTFGTGRLPDEEIVKIVQENFDLRPGGIIKMLDLKRPIYKATANYGHFGRTEEDFPWEQTDKAEALREYLR